MKYFGTVKSFDTALGHGEIKPETGGADLRFETAAISWGKENPPTVGQRLSYDVGPAGALNLQTI
jgi:cold shock CspA family protein